MIIRPVSEDTGQELSDIDISRIHLSTLSKALVDCSDEIQETKNDLDEFDQSYDQLIKAHSGEGVVIERLTRIREYTQDELLDKLHKARNYKLELENTLKDQQISHLNLLSKAIELDTHISSWNDEIDIEQDLPMRYREKVESSLGYNRDQLPQVNQDIIKELIEQEKVVECTISLMDLKFTQGEINQSKVIACMGSINPDNPGEFLIAKGSDGFYLLDGHHRVSALLELDPELNISAWCFMMSVEEVIKYLNELNDTVSVDINDKEVLRKAEVRYSVFYKAYHNDENITIDQLLDARDELNKIKQKINNQKIGN